jgi:flavin-dependent dehydrogenase
LEKFDALIVGAGVAGSTVAQLLARGGWSVAVVEKSTFPRNKVCGEYLSSTNAALLENLGILDDFVRRAGPEVNRVGLFDRSTIVTSPMPQPRQTRYPWGRALRREILDPLLLERAVMAGARVFQPYSVLKTTRANGLFQSTLSSKPAVESIAIQSSIVIAAHGSWELGALPTQSAQHSPKDSDLFGFKAHFENAQLPPNLMPMVVFPGGYGGMVNCGDGLVSLSFCIRRDVLEAARLKNSGAKAGEAAFAHITESCTGVRETLTRATVRGQWMSAGPIKPGIRPRYRDGIFCIGNAAGEAHPIIAEGISIAMQSAWLLSQSLLKLRTDRITDASLAIAGRHYSDAWLKAFRLRIKASDLFADLAMTGGAVHGLLLPVMMAFPRILTLGAKLSGKVNQVVELKSEAVPC